MSWLHCGDSPVEPERAELSQTGSTALSGLWSQHVKPTTKQTQQKWVGSIVPLGLWSPSAELSQTGSTALRDYGANDYNSNICQQHALNKKMKT